MTYIIGILHSPSYYGRNLTRERQHFHFLAIGYGGLINAEFNSDDLEVDEWRLARHALEHLRQLR